MDLAIVSALMFKENLPAKANCDLSLLTGDDGPAVDVFAAPKQVDIASQLHQEGGQLDHQRLGRRADPLLGRGRSQGAELRRFVPVRARRRCPAAGGTRMPARRRESWWWNSSQAMLILRSHRFVA